MRVEPPGLERLKGLAVPAAVVVLVWVALVMLHIVLLFLLVEGQGPFANAGWSPFGAWEAVVLSAVISVTVLWARPRQAPALVLAAVILAAVGVLLQVGSLIVSTLNMFDGLSEPSFALLEVLRMVVNLVLPVLALLWLVTLRADLSRATEQPALPQQPAGTAAAWQPEQARGAHWSTASGAATGSAASDWGTPGQQGGWGPPGQQGGWGPSGQQGGWGPPAQQSAPQAPGHSGDPAYQQSQAQYPPPAHQPRGPEQFGPQALADQYGGPGQGDDQTRSIPSGRREPPQWTPLERGPGQ